MRKLIILALGLVALVAAGCASTGAKQDHAGYNQRVSVFQQALDQVPTPSPTNFPRRKTLADAVVRQAEPDHPWYVYLLGQNGNAIGYYVARSVPVNDCDYLSNTTSDDGRNAPSLEGIYQSQTGCNTLTFFDAATNAEIQVTGLGTYITDRPLAIEAKPIKVQNSK